MKFTKLKLSSVGTFICVSSPVTTDLFFNTSYEDVLKVETLLPQTPRATGVLLHALQSISKSEKGEEGKQVDSTHFPN